jgi:hypothetical protein
MKASARFKDDMKRKRLSLGEVASSGEAIRIELFRKWFDSEEGYSRQ